MTIARTAYDTQACQGFVLTHVKDGVKKSLIQGSLKSVGSSLQLRQVTGSSAPELATPAFAHPYELEDHDPQMLVVDLRSFGKWNDRQYQFEVRNFPDYHLAVARAQLNHVWLYEQPEILRDLSPLPLAQMAEFVSKNVQRRFALDPREEQNVAILVAWHYLSCFTNEEDLDERERMRFVQAITRALRTSAEDILHVTDRIPGAIKDLNELCKLMETVTDSVRLKDFNLGVLFQVLVGNWFGTNAPEMLTVSLQHPPTWIAMLLAAASDRTFKKSGLTRQVERARDVQNFQRACFTLLESRFGSRYEQDVVR